METLIQDLKYSIRMLGKNRLFALITVLTLATGIGANTAIFSVVNGVLLQPLPYPNPEKIVVWISTRPEGNSFAFSPVDYQDLKSGSNAFESTAAISTETYNLTGETGAERVEGAAVSWQFFSVIGMRPVLGRSFLQEEEIIGKHRVAVISSALWKRRFHANPRIIGMQTKVDGRTYEIIGVASDEMRYPEGVDLWRPLALSADELDPSQRGAHWLRIIGRLKPEVSIDEARKRLGSVAESLQKLYPRTNRSSGASLETLQGDMVHPSRTALLILMGAIGFVLLIACANVMNLLLAQALKREGEVAVRSAMGAGSGRLIRQFLTESLLLSVLAGGIGILLAWWFVELVVSLAPEGLPRVQEIRIDTRVLVFTSSISLLTAVLIGLVPGIQFSRRTLQSKLQTSSRGAISGKHPIGNFLAISQIAMALLLLAGAGLLMKSFIKLQNVDPGFQPENVMTFAISLPSAKYEINQVSPFFDGLLQRAGRMPGVKSAGAVFGLPMTTGFNAGSSFSQIGKPDPAEGEEPNAGLRVATPGYLKSLGIPLRDGRWFDSQDRADSLPVAVINEAAARLYWPGESPIGQKIRVHVNLVEMQNPPREIVGVIGNVRYRGLDKSESPEIYIPHAQHPIEFLTVILRTSVEPTSVMTGIRKEISNMDSEIPLWNVRTMEEVIGSSVAQRRFTLFLLAAFAVSALILASLGVYGILSQQVAARTREIGIRMALGARKSDVLMLVFQNGFILVIAGTLLGLIGTFALTRVMASQLFQVQPSDPTALGIVSIVLALVGASACCIPAIRAAGTEPTTALRYE